ncbi:MAG TPA: N,N-dimethylformamidase beta subunit family domain-containing protein, partial [Thermomicrobiaceae bacterium]|nr:N,N-dimethylformamidase beta subunit family domain-containing protein [Thermomicrobiaceae bacterium]
MSWCRARLFTAALIVLSLSQFTPLASLIPATIPLGPSVASAASNPIQVENSQPGTTAWQIDTNPNTGDPLLAQNHEIEGYASLTSVNAGGSISFMVSLSTAAQYTLNIYRMGYYGGAGGRLMQSVPAANGTTQATCPRVTITTNFGLTECAWTPSYTLSVPSNWTTGDYIVKLKRLDSGLESYIPFTVRDDGAPADIVLSNDVTTWQAYNFWGGSRNNNIGYSLYGEFYDNGDNNFENIGNAHANAVSFNRPYAVAGETDGAGQFFIWDYPMVRWLESKGYNVTYATDIDIENNPTLLAGRKAFINTGHDEYYSATMRSNLLGYISGGAHAGFFSANNIYYQIRFANDAAGNPDRTIICYKNSSLDPTTIQWRYLNPPQPENAIIGVLQNGVANDRPWVVADASSWIFAGTGLANGQSIPSLVGYEFDERAANDSSLSSFVPYEPAGLQQVAHSPVPASDNGVAAYSDATLYTAANGAIVFAAGTMQWSWGLDAGYLSPGCGGCNGYAPNAKARLITSNILNKFLGTTPTPTPAVGLNPSTLAFGSQPVGTTSGAQAVTLTNAGSAALAISSIRLSGTNASDFAQTNTCPLSPSTLAAGASCRISVTFTPAAGASRSASVTIADNAPGSPHNVGLTGTGTSTTAPVVSLSPSTLAFGNQVVTTTTAAQLVTLANTGNAALTISSIGLTGSNPGDFAETTTCGGSLAAGASCSISVRFTPTTSGSRSANLSIADDAAGSPHLVALTGTGTLPAGEYLVDGFESGSLSAWGVFNGGGTTAATTTVVNSGAYAAVLTNAANGQYAGIYADLVGGPRAQSYTRFCFQIPASGGTTVLAQGRNVNGNTLWEIDYDQPRHGLDLYFWNTASPPSRYDLYSNANLIVQGHWYCAEVLVNETSSGQGQVWLNGTSLGTVTGDLSAANPYSRLILFNNAYIGDAHFDDVLVSASYSAPVGAGSAPLPIPVVSLSPASLTFADQVLNSTSAAQTVTLTNSGAAPLTISSIGVTGSNPGDFAQTTNCGSSLAAGASCSINVTFTPTAAGSRTARLTLVDNAGGSPQSVALAGSGTAATLSLSAPSLAFGTQPNGTPSAAQTVTVTNSGAAALTISSLGFSGADPGDFAQTTTCPLSPSTLGAGASCRISVTFVPTAAGSRSATLTLTDNAADSPQSVALSGSGSPAGAYLVDGFESGTLNAWTIFNGGGTATIETSTVNSGSYAAALTTTASGQLAGLFADLAGDAQTQSDTRFCFNLHGIGSSIVLAQGRDGNGANRWELDYDAGRQGLDGYF